ncbi:MAG: STAS domain-containing protein [Oscillospiraceae bacterium]
MSVSINIAQESITAYLSGEIDHHSAVEIRQNIDSAIEKNCPKELMLDFSGVTFMDSSGIGLVMGRYKLMSEINGSVTLTGLNKTTEKIMKIAGLEKLVKLQTGGKK